MRSCGVASLLPLILLGCGAGALAQPLLQGSLPKDSEQALQRLRIERLKEHAFTLPVDAGIKSKLILTDDKQLLEAALKDQSKAVGHPLGKTIAARVALNELANLAQDQSIAKSLSLTGIDVVKVKTAAIASINPATELLEYSKRLGWTSDGRIRISYDGVLITNPEARYDDKLQPGMKGSNPLPPGQGVWRTGLKFAVLLGMQGATTPVGHCSGTFLPDGWVLTAAHCLLDKNTGAIVDTKKLFAFFPFQAGTESVATPSGFLNKRMKRAAVEDMVWLGKITNDPFPSSDSGFTGVIFAGKDLALLKLAPADVAALPNVIGKVRVHSGAVPDSPVSALGYGVTNVTDIGDIGLLVGVREKPPTGIADSTGVAFYGANDAGGASGAGGICGGDSGGGLFSGRVDGQGNEFRLIGVVSSLVGSFNNSSSAFCLASQQSHTSLMTARNRKFVCDRAPAACS